MMRVGLGEDIHRLDYGRKLVLGGVEIPYEKGLVGHSDADVVLHAVSDAMLGALALGDIGQYFKVDDPKWDNADSSLIVAEVMRMISEKGYHVVNVDVTIAAEEPHLSKHLLKMRENLAKLLRISIEEVGMQAMTNEGMDAVGRKEAIRANAIVLLEK